MAFPAPPNWNSSAPLSAYFFEGDRIKQTDGFSFLFSLTTAIRTMLATLTLRDSNGVRIVESEIPSPNESSYVWDQPMLRLLWAAASALRAPREYLESIAVDAAAMSISAETLQVAIWVTYTNQRETTARGRTTTSYGFGSPGDVKMSTDTRLPQFGVPITRGPGVTQTGLTIEIVPEAEQPAAIVPHVRETSTSFWVAMGFAATIAVVAALAMSTVPSRPVRKKRSR